MNRRDFHAAVAALLATGASPSARAAPAPSWAALEARTGGRLGVAVLQVNGDLDGQRLDERFPMCSTFKWLAAACVLRRVDAGQERLDRRIRFGRQALLPHSPVTSQYVGAPGMTVGELCDAAIRTSDNAAANLLLASLGGPAALTAYARKLGDRVTRLDRREPALNEARPGDPRDTTTPRAMAGLLHATLLGNALSPASREQLARWLQACETNGNRLRAGLPRGWRMGSKTGTGGHGATHDVGIFWPPGRAPVIVAAYLADTAAPLAEREATLAAVAQRVTTAPA